jgi:hypothetical protein
MYIHTYIYIYICIHTYCDKLSFTDLKHVDNTEVYCHWPCPVQTAGSYIGQLAAWGQHIEVVYFTELLVGVITTL